MDSDDKPTHVRNWKNYLIGFLALAVTLLWFTRGCDNPPLQDDLKEIAYQDTIRIIRSQMATVDAKQDSIFAKVADRIKRDSVTIKQKDSKIGVAERRAAAAEAKISQLTRDEHPEVVEALAAKDTVILELKSKVDILQASLYDAGKQLTALEHLDIDENRLKARMDQECVVRTQQLKQDLEEATEKAEKVPVLKRVITWLGVALIIETAVLIVKD